MPRARPGFTLRGPRAKGRVRVSPIDALLKTARDVLERAEAAGFELTGLTFDHIDGSIVRLWPDGKASVYPQREGRCRLIPWGEAAEVLVAGDGPVQTSTLPFVRGA